MTDAKIIKFLKSEIAAYKRMERHYSDISSNPRSNELYYLARRKTFEAILKGFEKLIKERKTHKILLRHFEGLVGKKGKS